MSVVGNLVAISPEQLASFQKDTGQVAPFLRACMEGDGDAPPSVYLDKSWQAIRFVLTGRASGGEGPLGLAIEGGEELGDDVGSGPARFLTASEVRSVAEALSAVSPEAFAVRFDSRALQAARISPGGWAERDEENREYVLEYYRKLFTFYRRASERGDAVLAFFT